jgi:hypothetical protein
MTDPATKSPDVSTLPIVERLRTVEPHRRTSPGQACSNWYRNPDGPEAADTIEELVEALKIARAWFADSGIAVDTLRAIETALAKVGAQ